MKKTFRASLVAVALTGFAAGAFAGSFAPLAEKDTPPAVKNLKAYGMTPVKQFDTETGFRGWVMRDANNGQHTIIYTVDGKDALVAGLLIDAQGVNLTEQLAKTHLPKPDRSVAFNELTGKDAARVTVGAAKAKAEVTVMFDPNCGFCKVLHQLLQPSIAAGDLKVHYVPVGILGADSVNKAAGLLAAKDPLAAVNAMLDKKYEPSNDKDLVAKVAKNSELMRKHGFNGTPAVLYKGADGSIYTADGVPQMSSFFKALGIPGGLESLKDKPELARFIR